MERKAGDRAERLGRDRAERYVERQAFDAYVRTGKPVHETIGEYAQQSGQYVWRTAADDRVRLAHAENEGKIFAWDSPPPTGHPGAAYNCRCHASLFIPGVTEYAAHDLVVASETGFKWTTLLFVEHFYRGGGRAVDLREIGHLEAIAAQHGYYDRGTGALRRLSDEIADQARARGEGALGFGNPQTYDFENIAFAHGNSVVEYRFEGDVSAAGDMLRIRGRTTFTFSNEFSDPLDIRQGWRRLQGIQKDEDIQGILREFSEVGGVPFDIKGSWHAEFDGEVLLDPTASLYTEAGAR